MHVRSTKRAVISAADAVMPTIKKAGAAGTPLELIYAALREHIDCNYSQFEALMRALEEAGGIRCTPELAFYVPLPRRGRAA
jgi:hypothetical protein